MKSKSKYYPWVIMVACCVYVGALIGVGTNCSAIFLPVMAKHFGTGLGAVTSVMTVMSAAMAVCSPWVGKIIYKTDIRLLMTGAAVLVGGGYLLQGAANNLFVLYVTGAMLGVGLSMGSFLTVTVLLNNWFTKNRGMVFGITMSVSSVAGILLNPILNQIIENQSWRIATYLKGGLILLTLPLIWLVIRMHPADIGCTPWGGEMQEAAEIKEKQTKASNITTKEIFSSLPFIMMLLFTLLYTLGLSHMSHMQSIAGSFGFSSSVGAMMVSAYMVGEFAGKLGLGWLGDKYGIDRAVTWVTLFGMFGLFGLFFAAKFGPIYALVCALIFGPMTATGSVGLTMLVSNTFGEALYPRYYPYMSIASTVAYAVGAPILGFMYDFLGSWEITFAAALIGLGTALILLKNAKKLQNK